MADNTAQNGTASIAADDITTLNGATVSANSQLAQRVKVGYGDDSIYRDVSASFPLPVTAREPHDAARVQVSLLIDDGVPSGSEALVSYGGFAGTTALTAGTSAFTVPSGRVLRIQCIQLTVRGNTTDTMKVRVRAAATPATTSPHVASLAVALVGNSGTADVTPPREIEVAAGLKVGVTVIGPSTAIYNLSVMGYTMVP